MSTRKPKPIPGSQLRFNCGDIVARTGDERHEGEVVASFEWTVRVLWHTQPRCKEDVSIDELVLIERRRQAPVGPKQSTRPRTLAESPRAKLERWAFEQWERTNAHLKD
jgi:hypothetical protein